MPTDLATPDRKEILAITDLGKTLDGSIKGRALATAMKRSGKYTGTEYYRVMEATIWYEWQGGQILKEAERIPYEDNFSPNSHDAKLDGFVALINRFKLKKDTAYPSPSSPLSSHMMKS